MTPKKKMTVEEQEKVLSLLHKKDNNVVDNTIVESSVSPKSTVNTTSSSNTSSSTNSNSKKVQRVTVDFPLEVYEQMKEETENKGHTLKWFIVNLVKKHLADQ